MESKKSRHGRDGLELDRQRRANLGQFLTPQPVADLMASIFNGGWAKLDLLDAGAGAGALTAALVRRLCGDVRKPKRISVTAYEIDMSLLDQLHRTLLDCERECERADVGFAFRVFTEDFIAAAVPMVHGDLFGPEPPYFNAAIVNPPYKKIQSDSRTRLMLRSAGIETSNLYSGFVGLIIKLLAPSGELVAITPRSFCNGPYFRTFREGLLATMSLRRLHVFESRSAAFSGDTVLQENVILHAVKRTPQPSRIVISTSSGHPGGKVDETTVEFDSVVSPGDAERFIRLEADDRHRSAKLKMATLTGGIAALGLNVSTGRVVDFRAKEFLRAEPSNETAPLIYPCHFHCGLVHWPKAGVRKPNAIVSNERTRELLVPAGVYVLVKRFTSKEERRRIVACIFDPTRVPAPLVGFENHLNYFHAGGRGLTMNLARGLAAFLNSGVVDNYFREFSGHTQVNATDLRSLPFPGKANLERLGCKLTESALPQVELDEVVARELF